MDGISDGAIVLLSFTIDYIPSNKSVSKNTGEKVWYDGDRPSRAHHE
jgi:hypothetical protein